MDQLEDFRRGGIEVVNEDFLDSLVFFRLPADVDQVGERGIYGTRIALDFTRLPCRLYLATRFYCSKPFVETRENGNSFLTPLR